MEIQIVIRYCRAFINWLLAIGHEWFTLVCGGIITGTLWLICNYNQKSMTQHQVMGLTALFILLASFKAWKRERDVVLTLQDEARTRLNLERNTILVNLRGLNAGIVKRIAQLEAYPLLVTYREDNDQKSFDATNDAQAYVKAHLKESALNELYKNCNVTFTDLFPGMPHTKAEADMAVMLEKLRRFSTNLQSIIDNIDTFLPDRI